MAAIEHKVDRMEKSCGAGAEGREVLLCLCGEIAHPVLGALDPQKRHEIRLPGLAVLGHRLAQDIRVAFHVQEIIHDLERQT